MLDNYLILAGLIHIFNSSGMDYEDCLSVEEVKVLEKLGEDNYDYAKSASDEELENSLVRLIKRYIKGL